MCAKFRNSVTQKYENRRWTKLSGQNKISQASCHVQIRKLWLTFTKRALISLFLENKNRSLLDADLDHRVAVNWSNPLASWEMQDLIKNPIPEQLPKQRTQLDSFTLLYY